MIIHQSMYSTVLLFFALYFFCFRWCSSSFILFKCMLNLPITLNNTFNIVGRRSRFNDKHNLDTMNIDSYNHQLQQNQKQPIQQQQPSFYSDPRYMTSHASSGESPWMVSVHSITFLSLLEKMLWFKFFPLSDYWVTCFKNYLIYLLYIDHNYVQSYLIFDTNSVFNLFRFLISDKFSIHSGHSYIFFRKTIQSQIVLGKFDYVYYRRLD